MTTTETKEEMETQTKIGTETTPPVEEKDVPESDRSKDNMDIGPATTDKHEAPPEVSPPVDACPAKDDKEDAKQQQETALAAEDAEVSLKERLKAQRRKRTQQQQQQQQIAPQEEEEKTPHVRIDNFQRPLTVRALLQWLGERCGEEVTEERLWVNLIKTHCYVSFASVEQAQRCIAAVHGQRFPETNTQTLVAHFTAVSAKDAPLSTEAALKPGEWRHADINRTKQQQQSSSSGAGAKGKEEDASAIAKRESRNAALKRKLSEATEGSAPTANLFKRAAVSAIIHTSTGAATAAQRASEKESSGNGHVKKGERAAQEKETKTHDGEEEITLRHTVAQPSISWQPVSDEVAQKRISLFKNRIGGKAVK